MTTEIFDNAPCGYFSFFDDGSICKVNQTITTILQHDKSSLEGSSVEKIFTLPTRIFFQTHLFPLIKMHGHAEEIFLSLLTRDGQHLPVLLNAKRIQWEETMLNCCVFIVVPNRKKFEDELLSSKKLAEKALHENTELIKAKMEIMQHAEKLDQQMHIVKTQNHELEQFNHVVTHNLKEPLRKILLYTGRLKNECDLPAMEKLVRASDQMKTVVTGLQQYVWLKEKSNEFISVDLNEVVENASSQLRSEFQTDPIELETDNLPSIQGDAAQLQLMLYHLLLNAVKFKKQEKAKVKIATTLLKQNQFRTLDDKYRYDDMVRLEVQDEGMGFDPIFKEHIFELFRKLHFNEGQGIGLALCKKIVENHSGSIEAESEVNLFTRIIVWLPAKQAQPEV
ncbi:MAG: hypothetical protein H0U44_12160 [Flavisolibacter sp.]|jgi:sigma-B regulation protein RsbU (phosphoserine phosphatase)|nr:hypothetical protein [Flavisolibacter sp.]